MQREVALRHAIAQARNRRAVELETVLARGRHLRQRLRELVHRLAAIERVEGRFGRPSEPEPAAATPIESSPPEESAAIPPRVAPREAVHAGLVNDLATRHPEGFTVGQLREVLDLREPERAHSYDSAWTLANALVRSKAVHLAGTRSGPAGPVRVFRVPDRTEKPED